MKIGIHGINGKMGLAIAREVVIRKDIILAAASVRNGHDWAGKRLCDVTDMPEASVRITSNLEQFCAAVDVVIDFTRPDATLALLPVCRKLRKPLMIGTTGFNPDTRDWIERAAEDIPIVIAANTSLGVNILSEVCRQVAKILDAETWDIDILEAHHRNKVDAPSGTALRIGEIIAKAQNSDLASRKCYPYQQKRKSGDIGFSVIRGGDIIGEHTVFFTASDERLEFTHRAASRRIFAQGALIAALWIGQGKEAGLYRMSDVLGFSS